MYFTLYSRTKDITESKLLLNDIISKFPSGKCIDCGADNYWKMEGIFTSGAELNISLSSQDATIFLEKICDRWVTFGNPIRGFLASETIEGGCTFYDNRISMIEISLDANEKN